MRVAIILGILCLLPALIVLGMDYGKTKLPGQQKTGFSTVGELWIEYDRPSFEEFKAGYKGQVEKWNEEVLPWLSLKAFPALIGPGIAVNLLLVILWLLGRGPFRDWAPPQSHSDFARHSATSQQRKFNYRRK